MEEGVFLEDAGAFIPLPNAFRMQVSSSEDPAPQQAEEVPPEPCLRPPRLCPAPHISCVWQPGLPTERLSDSGYLQGLFPCLECCSLCPLPG